MTRLIVRRVPLEFDNLILNIQKRVNGLEPNGKIRQRPFTGPLILSSLTDKLMDDNILGRVDDLLDKRVRKKTKKALMVDPFNFGGLRI